jgi:hypothetical protein
VNSGEKQSMPLVTKGFFIDSGEERPYEVETTYQLKYYVSAALISIDYILSPVEEMMVRFENKVEYYRYHIDGLFNFLGLINDRFLCKPSSRDTDLQKKKQERVVLNKNNYQFTEQEFSILSNKIPRNIIEHLDERNVKTIIESKGVGGFNVIFEDNDADMVAAITFHREFYPYTLDLVNKKMLFYNTQAKIDDVKEFDIDILELQRELQKLKQNIYSFAEFVKGF